MNKDPKKATMREEGTALALYLYDNFPALSKERVVLSSNKEMAKETQRYLDDNTESLHLNRIVGMVMMTDSKKFGTGGRNHLIVGIRGPAAKAFSSEVVGLPMLYKERNIAFLDMIKDASGVKPPWTGNVHGHYLDVSENLDVPSILMKVREEHGGVNDLQQVGKMGFYELIQPTFRPEWRLTNAAGVARMMWS